MKQFWNWLWSLFKRNPKELPAHKPWPSESRPSPPSDNWDATIIDTLKEFEEKQQAIKINLDPALFHKAFKHLTEIILSGNLDPNLYIFNHHLKISGGEFSVFWIEFKNICESKGIETYSEGSINKKSFIEYIEKCKRNQPNNLTITEGPYR